MAVPNTFASATTSIPLANLDANFAYYDTAYSISGTAVTYNGTLTVSALTASTSLALNASKQLVSVTNTGSGNNVLATNPTLVTPILGTPQSGNFSTGTFTWPTFNQNTTGNAATATLATTATSATTASSATAAINIAGGTNLQIPYNTGSGATSFIAAPTIGSTYLQYNGTGFAWATVGGGTSITISNDTSTATNLYPAFFSSTSGTASTVYTSNAKLLYKPSTGELQASEVTASNGLLLNATTVAASYTIGTGYNAMSVGPVTVASGQSVTVSSGQRWLVF